MQVNQVSLTVKVNGRSVAEYQHEGRCFVEGREGTTYSLHIKNDNPFRVKVVPSVDGVNAINGKSATGTLEEIGYVLDAYQSFTCDGYRLDNDTVAAFKFVAAQQSYAKADKKMEGTTGVIGLRVWKEKIVSVPLPSTTTIIEKHYHEWDYPWYKYPIIKPYPHWPYDVIWSYTCDSGGVGYPVTDSATYQSNSYQSCCSNSGGETTGGILRSANFCASVPAQSNVDNPPEPFVLGSSFGSKVQSKVVNTTFEADHLLCEMSVYYSTREGLKVLGVDISRTDKVAFPKAFDSAYCQPPSGWQG